MGWAVGLWARSKPEQSRASLQVFDAETAGARHACGSRGRRPRARAGGAGQQEKPVLGLVRSGADEQGSRKDGAAPRRPSDRLCSCVRDKATVGYAAPLCHARCDTASTVVPCTPGRRVKGIAVQVRPSSGMSRPRQAVSRCRSAMCRVPVQRGRASPRERGPRLRA